MRGHTHKLGSSAVSFSSSPVHGKSIPPTKVPSRRNSVAFVTPKEVQIKDRVPQSSAIPTQQVDPKLFERPPTPAMLRTTGSVAESNEFRGPLITKDGLLYDDEEYDETYKTKLRLREIDQVRDYLKQSHGGRVIYEEDETLYSESPSHLKYREVDLLFQRLKYFKAMDPAVRKLIIEGSRPEDILVYRQGETVFEQGADSVHFYVILRGSTKAIVTKKEYGFVPFVMTTFYDGCEFGEAIHYQVSADLTPEMVTELNKQKYTCEASETTYLLRLDKARIMQFLDQGLHGRIQERINFLTQIDLFRNIDMHVLLPIANKLEVLQYRFGEFIVKEGQAPKGLFIITKGRCRVGSEQINMRSKDIFP